MDNAAIHFKGGNVGLVEWLWENHHVAVIPLPTRSPELNPMELVWRSLTMKIRSIRVSANNHATAIAATNILNNMSHKSTEETYRQCGYIN